MLVIIGTNNEGKVKSANEALKKYYEEFELIKKGVESEVSDEPVNDEIYEGAKNRVKNLKEYAKKENTTADLYISVESGITNKFGKWTIINVAVIEDKNGFQSMGLSQGFEVPEKYVNEIIEGDLCKLMDKLFNVENIGAREGGVSLLTKGEITRYDLSRDAFIMALIPHINNEKWKD